jgi:glycine/D-amino acid oxidase-like deaminating enzyme
MQQIVIVGCGIVGAMTAYELSHIPGLNITVLDRQPPAQAATGASLGVLMGIISHKTKGQAWAMRQASIQRYATLIPELESATGMAIPWNRQGIVKLRLTGEKEFDWVALQTIRQKQGWDLELWERDRLQKLCPQVAVPRVTGAIYSPQDAQVDATQLTLALVKAAQLRGVQFQFNVEVASIDSITAEQITDRSGTTDWIVIAAGLGSAALSRQLPQPIDVRPVLGQAMRVKVDRPLGNPDFQPMITGEDIHIVPLGQGEYWIGATVEFPSEADQVIADPSCLQDLWQGAIALCPALADAIILHTWSGLRPRPQHRPAPILERLPGSPSVLLATGHYRNGVLLAPATAQWVKNAIVA